MAQYYSKINTIFRRDQEKDSPTYNCILPDEPLTQVEFEILRNVPWECTEKIDGTNMSVHILPQSDGTVKVEIHGKTEKANIPAHLQAKMESLFPPEKLIEYFTRDGRELSVPIILFGEGYGAKIQSGGNYIKDGVDFILFDVKVGSWWLSRADCHKIASDLGIEIVPLIGDFTIDEAIDIVSQGFKSRIAQNSDYDAEGLVLKAPGGLLARSGERIITKIKTCDFRQLQNKTGKQYERKG